MGKITIISAQIENFEENEDFVEGFLADYWWTDETQRSGFKYTIKALQEKYSIKSSAKTHQLAMELGQAKCSVNLHCGKCIGDITVNDRRCFSSSSSSVNNPSYIGYCQSCLQDLLSQQIDSSVQRIATNIEYAQSFCKEPSMRKLSYLDAVFLYHVINYIEIDPQNIDRHAWVGFYNVECEGAQFIISRLVENGFISLNLKENELFDDIDNINMTCLDFKNVLSVSYLSELNERIDRLLDFKYYVCIPAGFSSFSDYSKYLKEKINLGVVLFDDIKDIKKYVLKKRHDELSRLFYDVCQRNKIPSHRLESNKTLLLIAKNFSLMQAWNIFGFKTTEVKSAKYDSHYLNKGYKNYTAIFLNAIKKYAEYLITNPDSERYSRNLPNDYIQPEIDRLIFSEFLRLGVNLYKMSAGEIINLWVDELSIEE